MKIHHFASTLFLLLFSALLVAQETEQKSVFFKLNDCETTDDLSRVIPLFGNEGKIELEVLGYTDHLGDESHNLTLSECRAEHVAQYLENALDDRIIDLKVYGRGELSSAGETVEGDPNNRRVDIIWRIEMPVPAKIPDEIEPEPNYKEIAEEEETILIDSNKKENIVLEGLQFIPGRHYPLPTSGPTLEKLLRTMKQNRSLEIEIQGFICCDYTVLDGFDNDTQEPKLSYNRAKFVYDYLVTGGIDARRLAYQGYGSTRPKVFPETSPKDEQANRRVEIKITKY
ncbi:MAG: OmpA family protein [Salibacteraceae bacterium]|nr:OmpA family protein [Salibacteraceae bacterium]